MSASTPNSAFLKAVYGNLADGTCGWTTSFVADPSAAPPSVWAGSSWSGNEGECARIDQRGADNNYYSVGVMYARDGDKRRSKEVLGRLAVLLADDVTAAGLNDLVGGYSYALETSKGNYQVGVILDPADPDTRNADLIDAVLHGMGASGHVEADSSGNNPVRYARLPVGSNTKTRPTGAFKTRLLFCDLANVYSLADAVAAFGLDLDDIRRGVGKAKVAPDGKAEAGDASELFRAIINPDLDERSYHDALLRISASWVASGMQKGAVVNQLRAIMMAAKPAVEGPEMDRWQDRVDEIPRMVQGAGKFAPAAPGQAKIEIVRADTIAPRSVRWLWPGWLACGKFHLLAGAPGTAKSSIGFSIAAVVTSGGMFPDGSEAPIGSALIWSGEDDLDDTIVPRFMANSGDRTRLHFVTGARDEKGNPRPFDPAIDFPMLENAARKIPDLRFILIDPVVSAVTGDSHKNTEVRRGLQPLVDFAADTGAALLGISHYTKGTSGRDPVERVTGSLAFAALPRLVMATAKPTEQGQPRRMVRAKSNIGPDGGGFEYDLVQIMLDQASGLMAQKVDWGAALEGSATALIAEVEAQDNPIRFSALDAAKAWLVEMLGTGTVRVPFIEEMAKEKGHAWPTVTRAKTALGVVSIKQGSEGWAWHMPPR